MNISVIVPVHNEEDNIRPLVERLRAALARPYEIVFVDDGSTDKTAERLKEWARPEIKIVRFPRRRGQSAAVLAGLQNASFDTVVFMDGDMQVDPADIPPLLNLLRDGTDYVVGWRKSRQDSFLKKISSRFANSVRRFVLADPFMDINGGLCVLRKKCVDSRDYFEGIHRFWPFIAAQKGFSVRQVEISHYPRHSGRSKYGLWNRIFKATSDLIRIRMQYGKMKTL